VKIDKEKILLIEIRAPSIAKVGKLNRGNKQKSLSVYASSGLLKRIAIQLEKIAINPARRQPRKDRIRIVTSKKDFCCSDLSWGKK
jgi:hypothetical protein